MHIIPCSENNETWKRIFAFVASLFTLGGERKDETPHWKGSEFIARGRCDVPLFYFPPQHSCLYLSVYDDT